jgi:hypothetical protein
VANRRASFVSAVVALLASVVVLAGISVVVTAGTATSASAATPAVVSVVNADGGVYWRGSPPDWNNPIRNSGYGVYNGDRVELECWTNGSTVPPYNNNPLWYRAHIVSGVGKGSGYVNDHFLNTGINQPNVAVQGVSKCGASTGGSSVVLVSSRTSPVVVNGVNVGYAQNARHGWGACTVQDFKGGPYGWVVVSYAPTGTRVVRNGMLWGWFDHGGGPGALGCPTSGEYGYMNGIRQDFRGGSLYWNPGMDHAATIDPGREKAVAWAWAKVNRAVYQHLCLQFVVDAYQYGQGWHLTGGPYDTPRHKAVAADWWYSRSSKDQHKQDVNPPRGALVLWDHAAAGDGSGHIALSLGGGLAVSTQFGNTAAVHVIRIADYPRYYLGWVDPR